MSIKKITPDYFKEVKRTIRWSRPQRAVKVHGISLSTALNIKGCKNYAEYMQLVKSEHNEIQYSLREDVLELYTLTYGHEKDFVKPSTAKQAIGRLIYDKKKNA